MMGSHRDLGAELVTSFSYYYLPPPGQEVHSTYFASFFSSTPLFRRHFSCFLIFLFNYWLICVIFISILIVWSIFFTLNHSFRLLYSCLLGFLSPMWMCVTPFLLAFSASLVFPPCSSFLVLFVHLFVLVRYFRLHFFCFQHFLMCLLYLRPSLRFRCSFFLVFSRLPLNYLVFCILCVSIIACFCQISLYFCGLIRCCSSFLSPSR